MRFCLQTNKPTNMKVEGRKGISGSMRWTREEMSGYDQIHYIHIGKYNKPVIMYNIMYNRLIIFYYIYKITIYRNINRC